MDTRTSSSARPAVTLMAAAAALVLGGCVTLPSVPSSAAANSRATAEATAARATAQPLDRAQRNVTGFTPALRCMDDMLLRAGVRDLTMVLDEVRDATQRVPVGARDMMTSAVSEMTRRSRAVRLSLIGGESGSNLLQALQQAKEAQVFAVLPEFTLRGGLSQMDEDVERRTAGIGLQVPLLGLRLGAEQRFAVMGFDAAMLRTDTQTLLPGVTSRNTTVLRRQEAGASDGQATLRSATGTFALTTARSEGVAQATRAMVELAALELVGKLTRLPYWQCLGTRDDDPEVRRELDDWFASMDEEERVAFVKERLRDRRWLDGAIDGRADADFLRALGGYRQALGLAAQGPLDGAFFREFITRPAVEGPLAPARRVAAAAAAAPRLVVEAPVRALSADRLPNTGAPFRPTLGTAKSAEPVDEGAVTRAPQAVTAPPLRLQPVATAQGFALVLQPTRPGYAYCYAQDPTTQAMRRVFPNRFQRDPRIEPGRPVVLPGRAGFVLSASHRHACVFASREVYGDLPAVLRWGDFHDIKATSFEEIRDRFAESTDAEITLVNTPLAGPVVAAAGPRR